jgi:hypothetical protein
MTESTTRSLSPAQTYVATVFAALGARDPMEVLVQTPARLGRAVSGLSAAQERQREAQGKWSVRHVVQHLADAELVGGFRYRMVLAHDAPALPGYDQDLWAERMKYEEVAIDTALGDFTAYRQANLRLLQGLAAGDLTRVMRHSERGDESVAKMIRMYAGHDLIHLRQIARIRRAIGAPPAE